MRASGGRTPRGGRRVVRTSARPTCAADAGHIVRAARAHRKHRRPKHVSVRVRNQRLRAAAAVGMFARAGFGRAACRRLVRSWRLGARAVDRSMPVAQPWWAHGARSSHRPMDSGRLAGRTRSAAPGQASSTNRIGRRSGRAVFVCLFVCLFACLLSILPSPAVLSGARTLTEHSVCETDSRPTDR